MAVMSFPFMSLTAATLLTGLALILVGAWFLWNSPVVRNVSVRSLRDPAVTLVLLSAATAWFLWKVMHLGESDFGNYRKLLFVFFLGTAVGSWFFVRDFLAVRAAAALYLMLAGILLHAAYGLYEIPQRLVLVTFLYFGIAVALYLAAVPYRLRDFFGWLFARGSRQRILGGVIAAYGLALLLVAATY